VGVNVGRTGNMEGVKEFVNSEVMARGGFDQKCNTLIFWLKTRVVKSR
jgi:hypothetical protein